MSIYSNLVNVQLVVKCCLLVWAVFCHCSTLFPPTHPNMVWPDFKTNQNLKMGRNTKWILRRLLENQWVTLQKTPLSSTCSQRRCLISVQLPSASFALFIFTCCAHNTEIAVFRENNHNYFHQRGWGDTTHARLGQLCMPFLNHHLISSINPGVDLPPLFFFFWFQIPPRFKYSLNLVWLWLCSIFVKSQSNTETLGVTHVSQDTEIGHCFQQIVN